MVYHTYKVKKSRERTEFVLTIVRLCQRFNPCWGLEDARKKRPEITAEKTPPPMFWARTAFSPFSHSSAQQARHKA